VSNLYKNISIYSFGNFLSKGVSFLLLPLYTRVLMPADYGKLELVYLVGTILVILFGFNVELGYNRIYFFKKDTRYRKTLYTTGQSFNLFCSLIFAFFLISQANWLSKSIFDFEEGGFFFKLISIITIIEVMTYIPLNNIRIRQKAKTFVFVSLIQLIIISSLTIILIVYFKMGVLGVLYARIIGLTVTLGILYYVTRREFIFSFSRQQLKLMLGFSIFLIPANLSAIILNMSNRYFLQEYQSLDDVGLYSLGAKIAGIIPFLFTEPVKKAFSPYLFELVDNKKECKALLANFTRVFLVGLSIIALSFSLFSRELIMLMADQAFQGSHNVVFVLSISYIFLGASGLFVLGIHITRKTWIISIIFPLSAIVNVVLNIWLIPVYGRMGAAYSTLVSVILISLLYLFSLNRVYPVDFQYLKFIKLLILVVLFNYIGSFVQFDIVISIILKIGLLFTYIFILYLWGVFNKSEINKVKLFVSSKLRKS
jgi:O-antigen/teichoic acid export membrane protein